MPRLTRQLRNAILDIKTAVDGGHPFSFDLEDLRVATQRAEVNLSNNDVWSYKWHEWAERLNASGRVVEPVVLFGFAASRGRVVNDADLARTLGCHFVEFAYSAAPHAPVAIGLPREVRDGWDEGVARTIEARLIELGCVRPV
jgi:hypothetical protein